MLRWQDCVCMLDVDVGGVRVIGCGLPDGFYGAAVALCVRLSCNSKHHTRRTINLLTNLQE